MKLDGFLQDPLEKLYPKKIDTQEFEETGEMHRVGAEMSFLELKLPQPDTGQFY